MDIIACELDGMLTSKKVKIRNLTILPFFIKILSMSEHLMATFVNMFL